MQTCISTKYRYAVANEVDAHDFLSFLRPPQDELKIDTLCSILFICFTTAATGSALPPVCLSARLSALPRCPWQNCSHTTQLGRVCLPDYPRLTSDNDKPSDCATAEAAPWKPTAMSPLHAHYIVCSLALPPHGHFAPPSYGERVPLGRRTERPTQDGRRDGGLN